MRPDFHHGLLRASASIFLRGLLVEQPALLRHRDVEQPLALVAVEVDFAVLPRQRPRAGANGTADHLVAARAERRRSGRNWDRKDNEYFSLDWRLQHAFRVGTRAQVIPSVEMFNTFNNANNVNPLTTPALFNFDGFLRQGVGDPRQLQVAVKVTF